MKKKIIALLVMSLLFAAFPAIGFADGLQTDMVKGNVGDSFTVSYVIPNRVENVGAITLYLNYDSSVLSASAISPKSPVMEGEDGDISKLAPRKDSSGSVVASWVEPYCSMVLEPGFELLTVKFTFIGETEGTKITSDMILKGLATPDSYGNDDLTALAGVSNIPIEVATKNADTPGEEQPQVSASPVPTEKEQPQVSASPTPTEKEQGSGIESAHTVPPQPIYQEKLEQTDEAQTENGFRWGENTPDPTITDDAIVAEGNEAAQNDSQPEEEMNAYSSIIYVLCVFAVAAVITFVLVRKKKEKEE